MKKVLLILVLIAIVFSGCSAKEKVKLNGDYDMGTLPSDMAFDEVGQPMIITISTESDGDILMSYINTSNDIVIQMYGCAYISLACGTLHEQGSFTWHVGQ